jgi:hypothetical protein
MHFCRKQKQQGRCRTKRKKLKQNEKFKQKSVHRIYTTHDLGYDRSQGGYDRSLTNSAETEQADAEQKPETKKKK